jgi:putative tryptophan/tyrosine transport system substrate-binding protein
MIMRRRDFIKIIGGTAAAWPLVARAQTTALPTIGLLHSTSNNYFAPFLPSVRQGLAESGWTDGQNMTIEYRWAEGHPDRLPALAADLVSRQVAVIFTVGGSAPGQAAKSATSTIPIVFISAADPIKAGLVASLNRPGGNVTGVSLIGSALEAKRLEVLHQITPKAVVIGVLVNPNYPDADRQRRELQQAADTLKQPIAFASASTSAEIDAAFAALAQQHAAAVVVAQDIFFNSRVEQIVALAARQKLPAIYNQREYAAAGGLVSYGTHFADGYRQAGVYLGKILKGMKPADLPVMQPTRFEMVLNLKTAKTLGLDIPPTLLALADEVIE